MLGIVGFLSYKYGIDRIGFRGETLAEMARYEGLSIKWVKSDSQESGLLCWGKGPRMERPNIYLRKQDKEENINTPAAAYTIAHELGHYFLHPYLKYMDLRVSDDLSPALRNLSGISQREADQFATNVFIPTEELSGKFEDQVIEALLTKDNRNEIESLISQIYDYCCDRTKELTHLEDIKPNAKRNLIIKSQKFIDQVREKVLLYYQELFPNENLQLMSPKDKESLLTKIKNVFQSYDE